MKDNKYMIPSLIAIGIIMVVIGSTFAYWNWQSTNAEKTNVTFTVGSTFSCSANGGGNITNTNYLIPTDCDNETYALKREITVSTTSQVTNEIINLSMDLNIDSISPALLQTDYFMYALTQNANSCNGAISGGSFKDNYDSVNKTVPLLTNEEFVGTESKTYYLYIWLDKDETDSSTMNASFSASLEGSCADSGNILKKVYANFGSSSAHFKAAAYRANITSVSFVNEINIPDNATNWNVGTSPSNTDDVKAWLEDDNSGNNTFALKIGANGTVFATNLSNAFYNITNASNLDFNGLNTSETTNMSNMFFQVGYNASSFNVNLGNYFDTSKVTNMAYMFFYAGAYSNNFSLNLGNDFDTSRVTNMSQMFIGAGQNAADWDLDLGNYFDTSNVINMENMFHNMGKKATTFDLNLGNQFNTSNVINMYEMFANAGRNATNFNLNLGNHFNTINVNNMYAMFSHVGADATNWNLNLGNNFYTNKVNDMESMFHGAGANATTFNLNLGEYFNTSNVNSMYQMFTYAGRNATNFSLNLGNHFDTSNVSEAYLMFGFAANKTTTNFTLDFSAGNFTNVTHNTDMFTYFGNNKATIYVKDANAQSFIIAQNNGFSASNVLIK